MSNSNITSVNQKLLNLLGSFRLGVIENHIDERDLHIFLNQYIALLQFSGQYSATSVTFNSTSSQKLVTWPITPSVGTIRGCTRIKVRIGQPAPAIEGSVGWDYIFDISFSGLINYSITMTAGSGSGGAGSIAYLPSFQMNYYTTVSNNAFYEFGFNFTAVTGPFAACPVYAYIDAPNEFDVQIPVLNTASYTPLTSAPINSLTLNTNNGTNFYCWATTSTNSGGITNGYV